MYKIVNYDAWWSYEKLIEDFETAFMIQQSHDPYAIIEDWSTGEAVVVWNPDWENIILPGNLTINIDTPNCLQ